LAKENRPRGKEKVPPLINLSTRVKICANFYATDF
jgi:hypothetical protein